jgi:hypothetical protein
MHRMKRRNKRSDAHDMMDITFKSVVHALRLLGIEILKNALLPSQYQHLSVAARKNMCMAVRKKMRMTVRKMRVVESKTIGMPTRAKQIKCTMIVDHLCWTQ